MSRVTKTLLHFNELCFLRRLWGHKGKRKTVNASFYLWCLLNSARGCFLLFLLVSSLQHSFMKGWVEVSFTQQRNYLLLMDSMKTGLCSKDMGLFKNGNSLIKDIHWSFLLGETHDRLFMLSDQKLAERKMWIGVTGKFYTLWTSGRQKKDYRLFFFFFQKLNATFSGWIINCEINKSWI